MPDTSDAIDAAYRTSSFSQQGSCVEVAPLPGGEVAVRNTRHRETSIVFTAREWQAFIAGVKNCEFDFTSSRAQDS